MYRKRPMKKKLLLEILVVGENNGLQRENRVGILLYCITCMKKMDWVSMQEKELTRMAGGWCVGLSVFPPNSY